MTIPPATAQIWKDLLLRNRTFDFDFLALKLLLGKLSMDVEHDPSPANILHCAELLHDLLEKNANLPSAKRDIQKLCG